jgi:EpsI family protein
LILVGICWINLGWSKLKVMSFSLILILLMFPPPNFLHNKITFKLKLVSSQLGVWLMQQYGMSAYREGNIIDLGFTQLQVVDACSGLRFLFPLFVLSLLLAYFFKASIWKKIFLVISSIPITIVTNSLRIALTGILYEIWGPKVAEGFFHGFSGWFIFMFALSIMLMEMWILKYVGGPLRSKTASLKVRGKKESKLKAESSMLKAGMAEAAYNQPQTSNLQPPTAEGVTSSLQPQTKKGLKAFLHPPQFLVAVILLGVTLVLSQGIEFREKIPISKSFNRFPNRVGAWQGSVQLMDQIIIDRLDLSDYIMVNYSNESGRWVNFYTAYYESQRKGESIHSPATCLPGAGWVFKEGGSAQIPMPGHKDGYLPVSRAFMIKSGNRQLSYYWFPQRDRILTNAYQLKIYNFWDALTRQRTDGALVRVITPVYDNEELAQAEKRLQSFTQAIVPVLDEFLPN